MRIFRRRYPSAVLGKSFIPFQLSFDTPQLSSLKQHNTVDPTCSPCPHQTLDKAVLVNDQQAQLEVERIYISVETMDQDIRKSIAGSRSMATDVLIVK